MGWGSGINAQGREVGYTVVATCDQDGCSAEIDRGLSYACGAMHDGGDRGCGEYFCAAHLFHVWEGDDERAQLSEQLCSSCADQVEEEQ